MHVTQEGDIAGHARAVELWVCTQLSVHVVVVTLFCAHLKCDM